MTPEGASGVLFLSHTGDRTGAPMALLHLVRWLHRETDLRCGVLFREPGPLVDAFAEVGPTFVDPGSERLLWRGLRKAGLADAGQVLRRGRFAPLLAELGPVDAVYSNTLTNGPLLAALSPLEVPVISHCHELGHWIRHRIPPLDLRTTLAATDHFVAASAAVAEHLHDGLGVAADRTTIVHEFVEVDAIDAIDRSSTRASIRAELGLPEDAFVVGGAGTTDPRKGTDLFVQLARLTPAGVHFVWIGGDDPVSLAQHRRDAELMGTGARVHLIGERSDAPGAFAAFDALALTSREDPYPLVMLECAALGVPMVCFDGSGGGPEFAAGGAAIAVPHLDADAMAEALTTLASTPSASSALGQRARAKVVAENRVELAGARIASVIRDVVARSG